MPNLGAAWSRAKPPSLLLPPNQRFSRTKISRSTHGADCAFAWVVRVA